MLFLVLYAVAPLEAPVLTEPPADAAAIVFHPHFAWRAVDGAEGYDIQVARDGNFADPVDSDSVHAVVQWYVTEKRLAPGAYAWRVRATKEDGTRGAWSPPRRLIVAAAEKQFRLAPDTTVEEVRAVAKEAALASSARIVLEDADYFWDPGFEGTLFQWEGVENVIIDGNGARVHLTDPSAQMVDLTHCRGIMLGGFSFYHEPCPLAMAELLEVDPEAGTIDVKLLAGFDGVNYPREVNQFFLYALDPENLQRLHPKRPGHTYLKPGATEDLGVGRRRYHVREMAERPGTAMFEKGDRLIVAYRRWPQHWVRQCDDVTFFDLRGGYSEGSLFMGGGNRHMKFLGCVNPPPYEDFPSTGAWVTGNDRVGPWVEGCRWEAMSDDGPNFTGNTYYIEQMVSEDTFVLRTGVSWQNAVWEPGDELVFWNPLTGLPLGTTSVVTAEDCGPGASPRVRVRDVIPDLVPGPDIQRCTQVYNLSTQNRQMVLRGNTLIGGRRFGFFIKAMDALVERNRFIGQGSSALFFESEPSGWEGLQSRNVVVQDNYIEDCGDNEYSVLNHRASIQVNLWRCNPIMAETEWIGHRGFLIRRNAIVDREGIGIGVDNAEDVVVEGNIVQQKDKGGFHWGTPEQNAPIRVFDRTRNVSVKGNTTE